MIDFRYHLVSMVAVFLALGLGLLLGATAFQPATLAGLDKLSRQEHRQIVGLYAVSRQEQRQLASDDQWAQAVGPTVLRQLLTGQQVVIVAAPGAPSQVIGGIGQALTEAGASITGQVQLQDKFFDASAASQQQLGQLAQQFTPPGATLTARRPIGQASQVLAAALMTRDGLGQPVAGQRDSVSAALLRGFADGGFLTATGHPEAHATLAVVVIPATPPATSDANPASQGLVTLAQQLNLAGRGTVVAGSLAGSGPGSAIDVMRAGARAGHLSSVDDADTSMGQLVVAQALAAMLRGVSGSYGAAANAVSMGPSPVPTPSASSSASPTGSP